MASTEHPKDYGIGMRIAEYRRALGWSQHQLAKRLKTNSHTVEKLGTSRRNTFSRKCYASM